MSSMDGGAIFRAFIAIGRPQRRCNVSLTTKLHTEIAIPTCSSNEGPWYMSYKESVEMQGHVNVLGVGTLGIDRCNAQPR